ncbi:TOBE domain-containing protein [Actinomadura formosensis]|uniref:TOBE domain-containing protein n=1 Tax=Actinomadura formosensis TaxID=60706 RepID=UPI000830EDD4|nr:helix-turn-helix domain-containing protein [Actinomadura formosensis]
MAEYRINEVATVLGVSPDTVRRWIDAGRLPARRDQGGRRMVQGTDLAAFARAQMAPGQTEYVMSSARNRLRGIITEVVRDHVMAQVEIATGPYRVVSLMSREAADQLDLQVGVIAEAVIKSTNVVVERPTPG